MTTTQAFKKLEKWLTIIIRSNTGHFQFKIRICTMRLCHRKMLSKFATLRSLSFKNVERSQKKLLPEPNKTLWKQRKENKSCFKRAVPVKSRFGYF